MEKFAVDLDQVLDEFEFNEDCAEQTTSVGNNLPRESHKSSGTTLIADSNSGHNKTHSTVVLSESTKEQGKLDDRNVYHTDETLDIRKSDSQENCESVNDYCKRTYQEDEKVQRKKTVDFRETESVSLTIHNDITQKLAQKKHNDNSTKNQNSYDKKLNQPNIKPSVSNVFSSLNDYINASSGNMKHIDCLVDRNECTNSKSNIVDKNINGVLINEAGVTSDFDQKSFSATVPEYQNLLLPTKLDVLIVEKSGEVNIVDTNSPCLDVKTPIDCSNHVYENVNISKKIYSKQEVDNVMTKHMYENIDFGTSTKQDDDGKAIYECIYIGKNDELPETTTELETAAKRDFQSVNERKSPIGFNMIDDLSEEELNKYLAELEAEERAKEEGAVYENVPGPSIISYTTTTNENRNNLNHHDDEDVNEAPIFESVTIGELPQVSEVQLQEKAKKFPVIDYSNRGTSSCSSDQSNDFFDKRESHIFHKIVKTIPDVKEKKMKKNKKTSESARKSSNNTPEQTKDHDRQSTENPVLQSKNVMSSLNNNDNVESDSCDSSTFNKDESKIHSNPENTITNDYLTINENNPVAVGEFSVTTLDNTTNITENDELVTETVHADNMNNSDDDGMEKPSRPRTLDIVSTVTIDGSSTIDNNQATDTQEQQQPSSTNETMKNERDPSPAASDNSSMEFGIVLGKQPPFWVPDSDAPNCMLCDMRFTVIKRRHHCRACGKVLCAKCCGMKFRLEYQGNMDSRVCSPCYQQLIRGEIEQGSGEWSTGYANSAGGGINSLQGRQPNPNNPMEYCSTIPPLQQLAGGLPPPPTVMVPVGVLKREGSTKQRPEVPKSVMFSDGIRPGCDLTELDTTWDLKVPYQKLSGSNKRISTPGPQSTSTSKKQNLLPPLDPHTNSYIPQDANLLPPTVTIHKGQISYHETVDSEKLYNILKNECEAPVMFAINRNLYVYVKITNLNCCVNRLCWNITSRGLACVGQDEVILLVEMLPDEMEIPKDLFIHINQIYTEAIKGNTITELGVSIHQGGNLLGSREHAGFLFIRQTFQCLQKIILPPAPFLVGLLVHRWETPWAKVFPLRLVLRLGAEYRYYPCPLVSIRFRDAVYFEIGHTIMKVLADFRNYAYTLPGVRGLTIHMQDRTTDILFPRNRYDQVIKGLNNSNDHVLAFVSNFSIYADSHLVCIQTNTGDESTYQTQAINIHNKPRKVTGASFVVINGALKSSMGLSAKSSIVEDGLMVQIMPEKMEALKAALKNMQDFSIGCGRQGAPEPDETVNIKWIENDVQFNLGVKSPIDGKPMDGIPSIRVHNGADFMGTSRFIRWTEVFIIKSDDHPNGVHDPVDINKLSESIARATCTALVKLLDLLATAGLMKLAVRTTIHPESVGYEAGSEGARLPPIYMNSLDNELIPVLHKAAQNSQETNIVFELIFHVLDD